MKVLTIQCIPVPHVVWPCNILPYTGGRGPSSVSSAVKTKSDSIVNLNQDSPFDEVQCRVEFTITYMAIC